jgi:hypothetical protein
MRRHLVGGLVVGIGIGGVATLAVTYRPNVPPAKYCIVSEESAAKRNLKTGTPVDAGGSGCVPSERSYCISIDGDILLLENC